MSETQAVAIRSDVSLVRDPGDTLSEAKRAAKALKDVIDSKVQKVIINGETYMEFEDWSTVGSFYGVAGGADEAAPCEVDGIKGAKAVGFACRTDTGIRISSAVAYCLRDEKNWEDKPFFQLASMAQTRAASKALRNVLSRVVVLAGYRPTPAEEMGCGTSGGRSVRFPFGKHKDAEPSTLTLEDLQGEESFWTKKVAEETNPRFKANSGRLLSAIKQAIKEKSTDQEAPPHQGVIDAEIIHENPPTEPEPSPIDQTWAAVRELAGVKGWDGKKLGVHCRQEYGKGWQEMSLLEVQALKAYLGTV